MLGSFTSSAVILSVLWISRSESALASPWEVIPAITFAIYLFCTFCSVQTIRYMPIRWSLPVAMAFGVVTFGVLVVVYRLGFGYDPFVHQAMERSLLEHGSVLPKQTMHLGQYVSVASLAWLSHVSIHRIDRALVPLVSVFVMIPMLVTAFRYGWLKRVGSPTVSVLALCLMTIGYFSFTVPFNFALIGLVLIVAFLPLIDQPRVKWLIGSLAGASLMIHPLVGLPAMIIALVAIFRKISSWLIAPMTVISVFVAFLICLNVQGVSLAWPSWNGIGALYSGLFANSNHFAGWSFDLIASVFLRFLPLLLIVLAIFGYVQMSLKDKVMKRSFLLLIHAYLGIVASAIIVPMFFKNAIVSTECASLLFSVASILLLPGIAYALHWALNRPFAIGSMSVSFGLACILLCAWFASYSQINLKTNGLSRGDLDTVQFIEANAKGMPYVALTPHMMGAGALMEFGFEKRVPTRHGYLFAYPIESGGDLERYFERFIASSEDPRAIQSDFNVFVDAPLTYIVIPGAWDQGSEISARLEPITSSQYRIGGNLIHRLKAIGR